MFPGWPSTKIGQIIQNFCFDEQDGHQSYK